MIRLSGSVKFRCAFAPAVAPAAASSGVARAPPARLPPARPATSVASARPLASASIGRFRRPDLLQPPLLVTTHDGISSPRCAAPNSASSPPWSAPPLREPGRHLRLRSSSFFVIARSSWPCAGSRSPGPSSVQSDVPQLHQPADWHSRRHCTKNCCSASGAVAGTARWSEGQASPAPSRLKSTRCSHAARASATNRPPACRHTAAAPSSSPDGTPAPPRWAVVRQDRPTGSISSRTWSARSGPDGPAAHNSWTDGGQQPVLVHVPRAGMFGHGTSDLTDARNVDPSGWNSWTGC